MTSDVLVKVEDGRLVVSVPLLDPPTPSSTGKSMLVAKARAKLTLPAEVLGRPGYAFVSVNAGYGDEQSRGSRRWRDSSAGGNATTAKA